VAIKRSFSLPDVFRVCETEGSGMRIQEMKTLFRRGMLGIVVVVLAACGHSGYNQTFINYNAAPTRTMLVGVLPFENLTTHRNAGYIASELLTTELYRQGIFRLIEQSRIRKWMANNKINPAQLTETTYAQAVARALGVHAVIIGSVSEFGYQHGLKEEPTVGINARLVSGSDGQVLWASSSSDIGRGIFNRDSANETAQRVVVKMVAELNKRVPCQ
jgi:TolB-like protein